MSYLNINYSTLEDAWGSNFEKSKKKKSSSAVCEMYNNYNSTKPYRPYKSVVESTHIKPIYEDDNYTKYYGYKDGRPYARKSNKLSKYNLKFPYKRHVIANEEEFLEEEKDDETYEEMYDPIRPVVRSPTLPISPTPVVVNRRQPTLVRTNFSYINEEQNVPRTVNPIVIEEEDEPSYLEEEHMYTTNLQKQVHPSFSRSTPVRTPPPVEEQYDLYESDEEFDSYLSTPVSRSVSEEDEYKNVLKSVYEETQYTLEKNIIEEEDDFKLIKTKKYSRNNTDKVLFDLLLYTISGIILIFIMEQFIQIGMKIKTTV